MKNVLKTFALIMLVMLTSCGGKPVFESVVAFDDLIWNRFNIIEMDVAIDDAEPLYDVKVSFVHTDVYPSDHIAMNITFYFPNGGMRSRDYEFRLQDAGMQWTGEKTGDFFSNTFPVNMGMRFPETGITRVRIENKMTKFNIAGIASVGLLVEKSSKKP
ncbi:MAG TPA: hypothetical protein PKE03_05275 [Bacteroidales bacterium]|nr:hypothetical protein [Bacteroidales bacterium]